MATSGTTAFLPDVSVIIEEAYDRAGYEGRSGYEYRTALRSLNILMLEWANIGLNLWAVDEGTISVSASDGQYDLPTDTIDIIDQAIRIDSADYRLERVGVGSWAAISNKSQTSSRPTQVYVERISPTPRINLWPVPNQSMTFVYWRLRKIQDAGTPDKTMDVPFRFIPALISGLAYKLALKRKPLDMNRIGLLKEEYPEQLNLAMSEDRGREPFFVKVLPS